MVAPGAVIKFTSNWISETSLTCERVIKSHWGQDKVPGQQPLRNPHSHSLFLLLPLSLPPSDVQEWEGRMAPALP